MSEVIGFRATPEVCRYCPEEHPAVRVILQNQEFLLPVESAQEMADDIYEAVLKAKHGIYE